MRNLLSSLSALSFPVPAYAAPDAARGSRGKRGKRDTAAATVQPVLPAPDADAPADAPADVADAPAPDAPEPATLTARARHALLLDAAREAGADQRQLRGRIRYSVATTGPKAECRHKPGANYAARFNCVTEQTQTFVRKLHSAFGFQPFDCEPHDAGKLARALGNGLIRHVSGGNATTTPTGLAAIGPVAGTPMLFAVIEPDCDFPSFGFKLPAAE